MSLQSSKLVVQIAEAAFESLLVPVIGAGLDFTEDTRPLEFQAFTLAG